MRAAEGGQDDIGGSIAEQPRRGARGELHLLAGVGLLSSGNGFSDTLETLGLVLLGLGLVP